MLSIGDRTFIGRARIAMHAAVKIGSNVCVNDHVDLLTASHNVESPNWETVAGPIVIKDYAWIAQRAIILPGVTIGFGAVVGAGAVVAKDVAEGAIVVGNPARPVSRQRCEKLDYSPVDYTALSRAWKNA
ncbi:acyltransferase [Rosistilla oblonga]|uniref:acyltransferase n=1 Tax=Rosistilla oblonga TaxID=2527990 RepID=UPI003A97D2D3